jgi:hypothetical protein
MSDIVTRLRREVSLEQDVQSLCREAADEIVRLRNELDSCVRTMNICIADYQKLRQVALDGDTLVAYRLGVKHAMEGEPESTFRERVAAGDTSPAHVAESPKERQEPVAWAVFCGDSRHCYDHYDDESEAQAIADMLAGDDRGDGLWHVVPLYRQPQPTLTDEEREAIGMARSIMLVEHDLSVGDEFNGKQPRKSSGYWRGMAESLRSMLERTQ